MPLNKETNQATNGFMSRPVWTKVKDYLSDIGTI